MAIECPTHAVVDAALRSLPGLLSVLDFSTIKNELFPIIAMVFSRTNSLAIKVRGLQAFATLCGGPADGGVPSDGLDGLPEQKKTSSSSALDKYTMQEKIVPLIGAIKTKEPAVMMAALNVLIAVGEAADADFVALEILPLLWSMSLGPLLDLKQFKSFMELIKSLGQRVQDEQIRKLTELSGQGRSGTTGADDFLSFGGLSGMQFEENGATEDDFESLVKGRCGGGRTSTGVNPMDDDGGWATAVRGASPDNSAAKRASRGLDVSKAPVASFSWSTPSPTTWGGQTLGTARSQAPSAVAFRAVTPDHLGAFQTLTPSSTQFSKPLQPASSSPTSANTIAAKSGTSTSPSASIKPMAAAGLSACPSLGSLGPNFGQHSLSTLNLSNSTSSFSLPPPPGASPGTSSSGGGGLSGFSLAPPPGPSLNGTTVANPSFGGLASMNGTSSSSAGSAYVNNGGMMKSVMVGGVKYGSGLAGGGSACGAGFMMMNNGSAGVMTASQQQGMEMGSMIWQKQQQDLQQQAHKTGLDKYESLL